MRKLYSGIVSILLLLGSIVAKGQTPVQVTPQLIAPYSLQVSDYYSGTLPKMQVLLLNRDINQPSIQVKLKMTVESQNCRMRTKDNANTPSITLTSGIPYYMAPQELQSYFSPANLDFTGGYSQQEYTQTGKLPEGLYSFYFEAYELYSGNLVSNKGFTLGWLTLADPPLLNTPAKAEGVIPTNPQNIIFNWTPRHNTSPTAAYYTDYVFTLVEYNDLYLGPEASFTSSPPLFIDSVQTTTYLFGPGQPQLIAGKRYAWRVQAKAKNGALQVAMFRNNGFSEVHWFTYQNNCPVPQGISSNVQGLRSTIEWQSNPQHLEWKVEYREKNNPDAQWFSLTNTLPRVMLSDLKPGTQYEYRVGGACEMGNFTYSALLGFTTAGTPVPPVANCGDSTLPAPGGGQTLQTLNAGDTLRAGSFTVHVGHATGTGTFTGTGYVIVPWLMNAKVEVRFTTITLSLDKKLLSGVIETTYDPSESGIDDIDDYIDIFTPGFGVGNVVTGEVTADTTLNVTIQWPGGIGVQLPPGYNPATGTGAGPITITIQPQGGGPAISYPVDKLPTTIKDKDGNVYAIDKDGNVTRIAQPGGGDLLKHMNTKVLDKEKGEVKFVEYTATKVKYAFDEWKPVYEKSNQFNKEYEKMGDYHVSQKAIAPGETDYIKVVVTLKDTTIKADSVQFVNGKGTIYSATKIPNTTNEYEIAIVGGPEKDAQEIYAVYKQAKTLNLGKVKVSSYPKKEYTIRIVGVNSSYTDSELTNYLKSVYGKLNITIKVEQGGSFNYTGWDLGPNPDGKLQIKQQGNLSAVTAEMKDVSRKYFSEYKLPENTIVLFAFREADSAFIKGMMPRGRSYGFIFTDNNSATEINKTVAHEIGHGIFALKHTFDYDITQGTLNNVMDYPHGSKFAKYQWDLIFDPAIVIGVFEKEEKVWSSAAEEGKEFTSQTEVPTIYYIDPQGRLISKALTDDVNVRFALAQWKSGDGYGKGFPYVIGHIKYGGLWYDAYYTPEGKFEKYRRVDATNKIIDLPVDHLQTSPPTTATIRIAYHAGQDCYYGYQDIEGWKAGDVANKETGEIVDVLRNKIRIDKWKSKIYSNKTGSEPECRQQVLLIDASALPGDVLPTDIQNQFIELITTDGVNEFTGEVYVIKRRLLFSYEDLNKNDKTVEKTATGEIKLDGVVLEPAQDEVIMWVKIMNDGSFKIEHWIIGNYFEEKWAEKMKDFQSMVDWEQKTVWQRFKSELSSIGKEGVRFVAGFCDWLASGVRYLRIPERYYNCNHPKYNKTLAEIANAISKILPTERLVRYMFEYAQQQGLIPASYDYDKISLAFKVGIYNGLIEVIASAPELIGAIFSMLDGDNRAQAINGINNFLDKPLTDADNPATIYCPADDQFCKVQHLVTAVIKEQFLDASEPCKSAHNIGEFVGPIIVACFGDFAALTATASRATTSLKMFLKVLKWCDNLGPDVFNYLGAKTGISKLTTAGKTFIVTTVKETIGTVTEDVVKPFYDQVTNKLKYWVRVAQEGSPTLQLKEATEEQLELLMTTADGRLGNFKETFGPNAGKWKLVLSKGKNATDMLKEATGLLLHDLDRFAAAGIENSQLLALANKLKTDGFRRKLINTICPENVEEALLKGADAKKFVNDLIAGLDNTNKSGLLEFFEEATGSNLVDRIKVWQTLKNGNHIKIIYDIEVLRHLDLLFSHHPTAKWGEILRLGGGSRKLIAGLEKLKGKPGLDNVLSDLAHSANKHQGAAFVVDFASSQSDEFVAGITKFEAYEKDLVNGIREYDIQWKNPSTQNIELFELKHWWSDWNSNSFKEQFIKDLGKMENLGHIQWKFKKTTNVVPDMVKLKQKVLSSLGSWDNIAQKWVAGNEMNDIFINNAQKFSAFFPSTTCNSGSDLINNLANDAHFNKIFEIISN